MSKKTRLIAAGCVLLGVCAAVTAAQGFVSQQQFTNTGLFGVGVREVATIYVSVDDVAGGPPARVVLQFIDEIGAVVAHREASVQAGQSVSLQSPGPALLRAHVEVTNPPLRLSARRTVPVGVEVIDTVTARPRSIPTFNPQPIPGGRD
jgi:hypothetical protein